MAGRADSRRPCERCRADGVPFHISRMVTALREVGGAIDQVEATGAVFKPVISRLGDRLHIAGTSELNGDGRGLHRVRSEAIVKRVEQLFPGAGDTTQAPFWTGLRPATPSDVPIIGRSKLAKRFLGTGHGTLHLTHACGSRPSIARIVSGLKPGVDFAFP